MTRYRPPQQFPHDEARRLRAAGHSYAVIAKRYGVSTPTVGRVCYSVLPESFRSTWVKQHWRKIQYRVVRGDPTRAIWDDCGRPQALKSFIWAVNEELVKYWKGKWRPTMAVRLLTERGFSAASIAKELGITERTVVRLRRLRLIESIAWAEDIIAMRAEGLSWITIKGRVWHRRPRRDTVRLRATIELYEETKLDFDL